MVGPLTLLLLLGQAAPAEARPSSSPNLLAAGTLTRAVGCANAARITDGVVPAEGDLWDTPHTAVLAPGGMVEWDLQAPRHLGMIRLQADNNDLYQVSTSLDGVTFTPAWTARPVGVPGMQTRTSEPLEVVARHVRLTAEGGDTRYSVGELELFDSREAMRSAVLKRIVPPPPAPPPPVNTAYLLVLGVAGLGAWLLRSAMLENRRRAAPGAPPPRSEDR